MIFCFDECIPEYAARMLGYFDRKNEMRASIDCFDKGTPDTVWLAEVSKWGGKIAVISGDGRILKNKVEKQVLKECGLTFVYLASGWPKLPWEEQAWRIVKVWPDIIKNVEQASYPLVFEVSINSKVQILGRISSL